MSILLREHPLVCPALVSQASGREGAASTPLPTNGAGWPKPTSMAAALSQPRSGKPV